MSKEPKTKKTKYKVSIGDRIISILTYVIYSILLLYVFIRFTTFLLTRSVQMT